MDQQMASYAHNPILPDHVFIPDVEAHVWEDGRIYLYGSFDIEGKMCYCSTEYHVYSSDDMIHWTDHGVSFSLQDVLWYDGSKLGRHALYAPDCAYRNGIYYLYYCVTDGRCGVATSASPAGPFHDVGPISGMHGIDPAVLIDDDGQAYIYWGQFNGVRAAKLKDSMTEIEIDSIEQPLSVAEHDFHEGSSVKKIDGLYYYLYTDTHRHKSEAHPIGMATCLGYAVSEHPTHGFRYGGVVIDNLGCDPGTWNNHGSLACFGGQWYVFYHRSTYASEYSRHVCVEPVMIGNGKIAEVQMTSSGVGRAIPAKENVHAGYACLLSGNVRITGHDREGLCLTEIHPGDSALYRNLSFDGERAFSAVFQANTAIHIDVYLDDVLVGRVSADGVKDREVLAHTVFDAPIGGMHTLRLRFTGNFSDARLVSFRFYKE